MLIVTRAPAPSNTVFRFFSAVEDGTSAKGAALPLLTVTLSSGECDGHVHLSVTCLLPYDTVMILYVCTVPLLAVSACYQSINRSIRTVPLLPVSLGCERRLPVGR